MFSLSLISMQVGLMLLAPLQALPNIVVIHLDDMLYTAEMDESYPAPHGSLDSEYFDINTTWINKIRDEGIIFPYAYCGGPKCAPSRYALLTGRYPSRSQESVAQINGAGNGYDPENGTFVSVPRTRMDGIDLEYNLPNVLRNYSDYHTGMVGKYHLLTEDEEAASCNINGSEANYLECADKVKQAGFNFVDGLYYGNIPSYDFYTHNPEWLTDRAMAFMGEAVGLGKPFFLYMAHTISHSPTFNSARVSSTVADTPRGVLTGDAVPNNTGMMSRDDIWKDVGPNGMGFIGIRRDYVAKVKWADESIGAIYRYLDNTLNVLDDTILVVLNDHGQGAKASLYERGIRIFHFVRYPAELPTNGRVLDRFVVSNVDLAPTLMEFAGIDVGDVAKDGYMMDGISWKSGVSSRPRDNSEHLERFSEYYQSRAVVSYDRVTKNLYKYIWRATGDFDNYTVEYPDQALTEQLYHLTLNSNETISVHDDDVNYGAILDDLRWSMIDHINSTCPSIVNPCNYPNVP